MLSSRPPLDHYRLLEGVDQLDPEAQWIATESAKIFIDRQTQVGGRISVGAVVGAYCSAVAGLVAERLEGSGATGRLSAKEATKIGLDALVRIDPDQQLDWLTRIDIASRLVQSAARIRALSPATQDQEYLEGYWPFSESGFCNPNKLG